MDYKKVRLTKISESKGSYEEGYWVTGQLITDPIEEGKCLVIVRNSRNGVEMLGLFNTSMIRFIHKEPDGSLTLTTQNSNWHLEFI